MRERKPWKIYRDDNRIWYAVHYTEAGLQSRIDIVFRHSFRELMKAAKEAAAQ